MAGFMRFFEDFLLISHLMKTSAVIGLTILALLWVWLAWILLANGGVNIKNLLWIVISGIIVFVPLWRKFSSGNKNSDK